MVYNWIIENFLFPLGDKLNKSAYASNLKLLRKLVSLDENQIQAYQNERLKDILSHAVTNTSFYSGVALDLSKEPSQWLKGFPIMDKISIKSNIEGLLTQDKSKLIRYSSSGSSGIQSEVYVNKTEQSFFRATQTLWWEWAGFKLGKPIVQTGLATQRTPEKKLKDFLLRTYYLFAFSISKKQAKAAFDWGNERHAFLGGYASSLFVLAGLAKELGEKPKLSAAITWGDKLFDHYKQAIEEAFSCKVYETYGANEGLMVASQKDLDFMYIMSPCVYLEILNEQGEEVKDGEMGQVVVTSLIAKSMPLIRFKLGDLAIKLPRDQYPLDRKLKLPILQKVVGRETDLIITPLGKKMIVHSFTGIFNKYPAIAQFCVIQRVLEKIQIQYIPGDGFDPLMLEEIKNWIIGYLEEEIEIQFEKVTEILPTKSGKPQIIISELPKGKQAF